MLLIGSLVGWNVVSWEWNMLLCELLRWVEGLNGICGAVGWEGHTCS